MSCTGGHSSGIKQAGDFTWFYQGAEPDQMIFKCPFRAGTCSIRIQRGEAVDEPGNRRWGWDGNLNKPTITPSVNCDHEKRCGWHGHIMSGRMIGPDADPRTA